MATIDKSQALDAFWNSFSLPAYDENTVPDGLNMPYITYAVGTDSWGVSIPATASLWYRETTWANISQKTEEIAKAIGEYGYYSVPIYGGFMVIRKGEVFAQRMEDPEDDSVRRMLLSILVEFLVAY